MQWQLKTQTDKDRTYINSQTGTEIKTSLIHIDQLGRNWWGFHDLLSIPYIRIAYSKTVSDLFQIGLTADDLKSWCTKEKALLRSNDPEKYEKLYSMVLEKESAVKNAADPLKQHLALATIYILDDQERIDYFSHDLMSEKLKKWELDYEAQAFFLTWQTDRISQFSMLLNNLSQHASSLAENKQDQASPKS